MYEILNCKEIFGSSTVQELYQQVKSASWKEAGSSQTFDYPPHKPKLKPEFMVPVTESHKRIWHVLKILGEGADLLCRSTNLRANRRLSKCRSVQYKICLKDLTNGARLKLFLGVYIGCAILGIGSRHLMKENPSWISQSGKD